MDQILAISSAKARMLANQNRQRISGSVVRSTRLRQKVMRLQSISVKRDFLPPPGFLTIEKHFAAMRGPGVPLTEGIVFGVSRKMYSIRNKLDAIAGSTAPVLILGESGTGKDLMAAIIHYLSSTRGGPFVKISCPAVPGPSSRVNSSDVRQEPAPNQKKWGASKWPTAVLSLLTRSES